MSIDNQALRVAIISKLKEYDVYIDNELPDYIMVMLANKKTIQQIHTDLQLFLGDDTKLFVEWLQRILSHPELLSEPQQEVKAAPPTTVGIKAEGKSTSRSETLAGSKRRSHDGTTSESSAPASLVHERSTSPHRPATKAPRISSQEVHVPSVSRSASLRKGQELKSRDQEKSKVADSRKDKELDKGREREASREKGERDQVFSKDQDLRALIRKRRQKAPSPTREFSGSEEEDEPKKARVGLSSVVQRPERPTGRAQGTGRLIQRAIRGIHDDSRTSSTRRNKKTIDEPIKDDNSRPSLVDAGSRDSTNSQPDITVEDDFIDEFREEQQQQLLNDEVEEEDDVKEITEEEGEEEREEVPEEQAEDAEVATEKKIGVILTSRDTKPTKPLTSKEVATLVAVRKVLPSQGDKMDLRLVLEGNRKSVKEPSPRVVVTMGGSEDIQQQITSANRFEDFNLDEEGQRSVQPRKARCRYWPNCTDGDDCPFLHPKEPCRHFPNCTYGSKCHYIHPQCKFDSRCNQPACPYLHSGRKRRIVSAPPPMMSIPAITPFPALTTIPSFRPPSYIFTPPGNVGRPRGGRFPSKSALHWKPHVSDRKFALPENTTSNMRV